MTQYESRFYSSINVASWVRSDAIIAAGALVELVTPELAALLERLGTAWTAKLSDKAYALTLAARIREALALEANDES